MLPVIATPTEPPPTTIALPGVPRMSFPATVTLRPCPISIPAPLVDEIVFDEIVASRTCTDPALCPVWIAARGAAGAAEGAPSSPMPENVLPVTAMPSTRPPLAPPMSSPPGHVLVNSLLRIATSASTLLHADTSITYSCTMHSMSRNARPSTAVLPSLTSRCDAPVNTTPPGRPDADLIDSESSPRLRSTS